MSHICTDKSLVSGGTETNRECLVCLRVSKHTDSYTGSYCHSCKSLITGEEFRGDIVKKQRFYLGMTRKQLGNTLGFRSKTVKKYELVKCPIGFWNKLQNHIKQHNKENETRE